MLRPGKYLLSLLPLLISMIAAGQNLITNGDFESTGGFTSNYPLINGQSFPRSYAITSNPSLVNSAWGSCGDHTTGSGRMMVVDGDNAFSDKVWEQAPGGGLPVTQGTTYVFSYWVMPLHPQNAPNNLPNLEVRINNVLLTPTTGNSVVSAPVCTWTKVTYTWVASSGWAQIWLSNKQTSTTANDFALDDLSLIATPSQLSVTALVIPPVCPGPAEGAIVAYARGGLPPYSYSLNGGTFGATNSFTGLSGQNNRVVTVRDANGQTASSLPLSVPAAPDLSISGNLTACGNPTTLTASGSSNPYSWSASPADPTLTTPNAASVTVHPQTTTLYTVTSTANRNASLLRNGDFEQGNSGFFSEYDFAATNPTGAQRRYGILSNPAQFLSAFAACADHSSGTGNMMVIDGALTANVVLWQQKVPVRPNTTYTFRYWVQSVTTPNPAQLETQINGQPVTGSSATSTLTAPATNCSWIQASYSWNSGNAAFADITLLNRMTQANGNDFALDDFEFFATYTCALSASATVIGPPVAPFAMVTQQTSCNQPTGTIEVQTNGHPAGTTYSIDGVNFTNTSGVFTGLVAGLYPVQTRFPGSCTTPATTLIINPVPPRPQAPMATVSAPTCTVPTGTISVSSPTGPGLLYSIDGVTFSNTSGQFSNLAPGTYSVLVLDGNCVSLPTALVVPPPPVPPAAPTVAATQPDCTTPTGSITITTPPGSGWRFSIDGSTFTNTSGVFSNVAPGIYAVQVRDIQGCTSAPAPLTIQAAPVVPPVPSAIPLPPDCGSSTGAISFTAPLGAGFSYSIDGTTFSATPVFSNLAPGTYPLAVRSAGGCTTSGSAVVIGPGRSPLLLQLAASNNPVTEGRNVLLSVTGNRPFTVLRWRPAFSDNSQTRQSLTAFFTTRYEVIGQTADGCRDTASLQLLVVPDSSHSDVWVPDAFTPNRDGRNDLLRVLGDGISRMDFRIFNRWGELVFATADPRTGWDGKYKGVPQPLAHYVYQLDATLRNGIRLQRKGTILLLR